MGAFAILYVLARPVLARHVPHLAIWEFPLGAAVVTGLLWAALSRPAPEPERPWRRHRQVVRALPDPVLVPHTRTLEHWLETGEAVSAAADVVARASTRDEQHQAALRARLAHEMPMHTSRRKREKFLQEHFEPGV